MAERACVRRPSISNLCLRASAHHGRSRREHPSGGFHLAFRITEKGMLTARWRACLQRFRQQAMLQFKVKQVSAAIDPMALNTIGVDHGDLGFAIAAGTTPEAAQ